MTQQEIYVSDYWNNRIQKWAPGATQGVAYVENYGAESLQVNWSGPGFTKQPIPDRAFFPSDNTDAKPPGIPQNLKVV